MIASPDAAKIAIGFAWMISSAMAVGTKIKSRLIRFSGANSFLNIIGSLQVSCVDEVTGDYRNRIGVSKSPPLIFASSHQARAQSAFA
jgi:hypothetical protein